MVIEATCIDCGQTFRYNRIRKPKEPMKRCPKCARKHYASKYLAKHRVDMLVKAETDHGRRVYMDFRRYPAAFSFERLGGEARDYLTRCGAVQQTPIERLRTMNSPAIEL